MKDICFSIRLYWIDNNQPTQSHMSTMKAIGLNNSIDDLYEYQISLLYILMS